jgi:acetylornithine deacetylase/succinyl-diaminopimelate desuccinylase-like protein
VIACSEGGSGPEADLTFILDTPLVFLGIGLPTDQIHAPNEHADVSLLLKGAEAVAYLWDELAHPAA